MSLLFFFFCRVSGSITVTLHKSNIKICIILSTLWNFPINFHFPKKGARPFLPAAWGFGAASCSIIHAWTALEGIGRVTAAQCSSHCLCWQGVHLCAGSEASTFHRPGLAAAWDLGLSHRQAGVGAWQRGAAVGLSHAVDWMQIADKPRGFHGAQGKQLALGWHRLPTCLMYLWELKLNSSVALFTREERLLLCWQSAIQ